MSHANIAYIYIYIHIYIYIYAAIICFDNLDVYIVRRPNPAPAGCSASAQEPGSLGRSRNQNLFAGSGPHFDGV